MTTCLMKGAFTGSDGRRGSCRRLLDSGVTQRTLMSKVQRLQGQLAAEGASNGVVLHTQPRSYTKLSNGVQRLRYACRRHALPISLSPRGQPRTHTHMAKVVCSPASSDGVGSSQMGARRCRRPGTGFQRRLFHPVPHPHTPPLAAPPLAAHHRQRP